MNLWNGAARVAGALLIGMMLAAAPPAWAQSLDAPPNAAGASSDSEIWRSIRLGEPGLVTIPDKKAGVMIQSEGEIWRARRNGPLSNYGIWGMAGMLGVLAAFFAVRGRIRIDSGPAERKILRFKFIERFAHWLTAGSFIILGVTGLNVLYGRYFLKDAMGPEAFAAMTAWGKLAHNWVAWAFMAGLALILVLWVRDNIWDRYDWNWIRKGGGLFKRGVHPPAHKFNFGQKMIFWAVILGGLAVSLTGLALLFPFYGTDLGDLQLAHLAHAASALALTAIILAHIYIGTLGMEGAYTAMTSGMVDENWAREHHSAWVEERWGPQVPTSGERQPAE